MCIRDSIEGGHCLVGKNAEVLLSVDAEDRGVPFVDEEKMCIRDRGMMKPCPRMN